MKSGLINRLSLHWLNGLNTIAYSDFQGLRHFSLTILMKNLG